MKKILLTGGSGFIGRHTLPFLIKQGYEVHMVVRDQAKLAEINPDILSQVSQHNCDLFEYKQQEKLFENLKPSHLLHFAWDATPGKFWSSSSNLIWVETSLKLLKNFAKYGGQRVVFAGTCAEYDWSHGYCTENLTPTNPHTLYGVCKNSLRQIFEQYCEQSSLSCAWGRIFWLYGMNEYPERLVSSVINKLLRKQPAKCTHGEQIRDFMFVDDVARAFVCLLSSEVEGTVNIATGKPVTIKEIVELIANLLESREKLELGAIQAAKKEPQLILANIQRLQDEVLFTPNFTLEQGLIATITWWKSRI